MTRVWLHFIGKKYYTIHKFKEEAKQQGISRAVAPYVLKKMEIGDTVLLVQKERYASKIFGGFVFKRLIGLTDKAVADLYRENVLKFAHQPQQKIERGCGSYHITERYSILDREKTMQIVKSLKKEDLGKVMIGGDFIPLNEIFGISSTHNPDYILCEIPFQMGYRMVDFQEMKNQFFEKWWSQADNRTQNRRVKLKGQFYYGEKDKKEETVKVNNPQLLTISNYKLN